MEEAILDGESPTEVEGQEPGGGSQGPEDGENPELETAPQPPSTDPQVEIERLRGEVAEARTRWLESLRRALLAENAGRVVPELVAGGSVEELERSVEVARRAFDAAKSAALVEVASIRIPTGNPIRQEPDVEAMSPLEKIAHGLKRE